MNILCIYVQKNKELQQNDDAYFKWPLKSQMVNNPFIGLNNIYFSKCTILKDKRKLVAYNTWQDKKKKQNETQRSRATKLHQVSTH